MPSRSPRTAKPTQVKKERSPVKSKPKVTVTTKSSPVDILHASWEFLSVYQFFNTFSTFFNIPAHFSIEKLEQALLNTFDNDRSVCESSVSQRANPPFLENFLILALKPLLNQHQQYKINTDNYQEYIQKMVPSNRAPFSGLTVMEKIKLLKTIEELYMETGTEKFTAFKNDNTAESLRTNPLGVDHEGWTYWYFGGTRLYREVPIPKGKRGVDRMNSAFTFELVCSTVEEWHAIVKKFERVSNKELSNKICDLGLKMIGQLESREATRLKNISKMKKAKEIELIPKKRSRRLEQKFEEEAKKQEILDLERQKEEYEKYERKKKLKDDKIALEQEKRDIRIEEARLRNEIHNYVMELISNKFETDINLKELKNQMSTSATEQDHIIKMQGWISLLANDITLKVDQNNLISFTSTDDHLDEALEFNLFKNTLRTIISTLLKFKVEPETEIYFKLNEIYKGLLLKRYDHVNTFCLDLNNTLNTPEIKQEAVNLLNTVFNQ